MPSRDGTRPPWLHGKFKGCGYRLTIPRQAILDELSNTTEHLSAEDIYLKVHKTPFQKLLTDASHPYFIV